MVRLVTNRNSRHTSKGTCSRWLRNPIPTSGAPISYEFAVLVSDACRRWWHDDHQCLRLLKGSHCYGSIRDLLPEHGAHYWNACRDFPTPRNLSTIRTDHTATLCTWPPNLLPGPFTFRLTRYEPLLRQVFERPPRVPNHAVERPEPAKQSRLDSDKALLEPLLPRQ